ncbi:MAG TPA: alkene reductase [Accumulibacter sp.]|uniref:alkene reductase n=1 Tax=Accumulibacter sp. TaxID=2053492 RepID=UPI0025DA1DD6|nr:alkene reductase [Accumulibacter sp.]MCM8597056.1 alkene reductase [Accumulibacter sp.]MCM8663663.1 alkene reductase [Accumulibacter sp.]HNC51062.1 alkene reductase [Accumulibacter sp.]
MTRRMFSRYSLGGLSLPNRVVMAPMNRNRALEPQLAPAAMSAVYYAQRASAGLIIGEGTPVSLQARGCAGTPGIYNAAQVAGWRWVTDAVHRRGGRIFLQLWHVGRVGHCSLRADASPPVGPSTIGLQNDRVPVLDGNGEPVLVRCDPPRALRTEEIRAIVGDFARAAGNAIAAGFDGVEIHAANGYLFDQFRCPYLNDRADEYGGATRKRWRFLLETVAAVARAVGSERVGVRISPLGTAHEMQPDPAPLFTYGYLACRLDELRIAYLHVYDQSGSWIHDSQSDLLQQLRSCYSGTMILCGGFDAARAEAALRADSGDLIAFGKHFIANPDLVERLRIAAPLASWHSSTIYKGGANGYIDYPTLQQEALGTH